MCIRDSLELHRTHIADRRVPTFRIVEAFNVVEHVGLRLIPRSIYFTRGAFGLERGEEALHRRIVPYVARAAHRADDAVICHQPLELLAGLLGGLKWSSQHFDEGGCDEGSKAAFGPVWSAAIVVAGSTLSLSLIHIS